MYIFSVKHLSTSFQQKSEHQTWVDVVSENRSSLSAGLGDMAVSNTIGSNVFDILVGLGLPWALQTMAISYGSVVSTQPLGTFWISFCLNRDQLHKHSLKHKGCFGCNGGLMMRFCVSAQVMINSRGLVYSVVLLLGSVALTVSDSVCSQPTILTYCERDLNVLKYFINTNESENLFTARQIYKSTIRWWTNILPTHLWWIKNTILKIQYSFNNWKYRNELHCLVHINNDNI